MTASLFRPLFALLVCLPLLACQAGTARWHEPARQAIDKQMSEAEQHAQPAAAPAAPPSQAAAEPVAPEPRFDLNANRMPARELFMALVQGTPYSMVVHPDIKGEVTLQLKHVTVEEAMQTLQTVHGYAYRREGNRYVVLGQGIQTRIFPVNYLNFDRRGMSDTRVSASELSQNGGGSSSSGSGSTTGSSGSGSSGGGTGVSAHGNGIQLKTHSESNFWKELKESLEAIVGTENGRKVVVHPQAGLVIVRAMPEELMTIERYLGATQATINRQVVLEAKIVEVELSDSFQSGINWSMLKGEVWANQTGGGTVLSSGVSEISGARGNLNPSAFAPVNAGLTSAFGGVFSLAVKSGDFTAFIELLQGQGDVQVLSSPRVSTVNNQRAVIKVGGDEFFVTGITNNTTTTGATTTQIPSVELTPFFSGIALDVTPQIDEKENIVLHIHPTVSNVSQKDKTFVVSGDTFSLPLAVSSIQESDNVVRAQNGQVIVIGGLMKEASSEINASVPLLGDIPIIGNLFKHKKLTRVKKELVILLRPTVVDSNRLWGEAVRDTHQRINALMDVRQANEARSEEAPAQ
ncbi:MAG: pilus (MSHA type) biogenesis protein MshL [Pseudomonadota bacterium]